MEHKTYVEKINAGDGKPFDINAIKCRKCGGSCHIKLQSFNNGSVHKRVECTECFAFQRYAPTKETSLKDRMVALIRKIADMGDPTNSLTRIDYRMISNLISEAQSITKEFNR